MKALDTSSADFAVGIGMIFATMAMHLLTKLLKYDINLSAMMCICCGVLYIIKGIRGLR